ncbi:Uncharacterised protein [Bordetella pertussis]|nr:Uncharacterised protein [Bordetella pertussis]CPO72097.1 Uncharacterised protein [Bordetella pertussis]CPO87108.1 Uncharacterised protein [Bordetella pertussis]CRE24948.1 Uncharacterised protein [Bordetella pertussis]
MAAGSTSPTPTPARIRASRAADEVTSTATGMRTPAEAKAVSSMAPKLVCGPYERKVSFLRSCAATCGRPA